jgi:hypothetical protein
VHPPPISAEEVQDLGNVLAILEDRKVPIRFRRHLAERRLRFADAETARCASTPPFVFPATGTVFGTPIQLGTALGELPDVRVVQLPSLAITPTPR